jgi:hypothetical protein
MDRHSLLPCPVDHFLKMAQIPLQQGKDEHFTLSFSSKCSTNLPFKDDGGGDIVKGSRE